MHTSTRFPIERYAAIDRAIRGGGFPNAATIARELEVCPRTIQRDITRLRDHHGAPIEYVARMHGYAYTNADYQLNCPDLSEGELLALVLAERVLQQYRGTPYAEVLASAFARLTAGLDQRVTIDLSHFSRVQSFRTNAAVGIRPKLFEILLGALRDRRILRLRYWSASRDEVSDRTVDPYHLASIDGQWYLVGFCHLRKAIRTFVPSRIRSARDTGKGFDAPAEFDFDNYIAGAFGVIRGDDAPTRVRLRFTGHAARFVRERTWHHTQTLEPAANGDVILTFQLAHLREVERFALSWMPECEVLEPAELRANVAEALSHAIHLHTQ